MLLLPLVLYCYCYRNYCASKEERRGEESVFLSQSRGDSQGSVSKADRSYEGLTHVCMPPQTISRCIRPTQIGPVQCSAVQVRSAQVASVLCFGPDHCCSSSFSTLDLSAGENSEPDCDWDWDWDWD